MSSFNPYLRGLGQMNVADLVEIIHRAHGANETTEIEWKLQWDLGPRPRRAKLAKQLIGLANRDPDQAARCFGGHAFLVIGVEPGKLVGAPVLDPAVIVQRLGAYVGTELGWHPVYVTYEDIQVLVLVVDPPMWGDPIHALKRGSIDEQTGEEFHEGAVYVRRPGITDAAHDGDLVRLRKRAATPSPRLAVRADWNLGSRGSYVGVRVANGPQGHDAMLQEVGFTFEGTADTTRVPGDVYPPGEPDEAVGYISLLLSEEPTELAAGKVLHFREALAQLPWFWDNDTDVYPYVIFDEGHWLVGEAQPLPRLLADNGWNAAPDASPMFAEMCLDYVWPEEVAGLRARFDLRAVEDVAP